MSYLCTYRGKNCIINKNMVFYLKKKYYNTRLSNTAFFKASLLWNKVLKEMESSSLTNFFCGILFFDMIYMLFTIFNQTIFNFLFITKFGALQTSFPVLGCYAIYNQLQFIYFPSIKRKCNFFQFFVLVISVRNWCGIS